MTLEEKASILVGTGMDGVTDAAFIGNVDKLVPGAAGSAAVRHVGRGHQRKSDDNAGRG